MLNIDNPSDYGHLSPDGLLQEEGELLLEQAIITQRLAHVKAWMIRHQLVQMWPNHVYLHYVYEYVDDSRRYWIRFSTKAGEEGIDIDGVEDMRVLLFVLGSSYGGVEGRGILQMGEVV